MSDTQTAPVAPEGEEQDSAVIRELREKAERTQKAEAEAAALRREMAFDRAGVPTEGPGKYFRQAYDGELDPEQIRAAAEADAVLAPAAATTPDAGDVTQIASAMAGGDAPTTTTPNDQLRDIGKDGFGDQQELDQAIAGLGLTSEDFDRIAMKPYG